MNRPADNRQGTALLTTLLAMAVIAVLAMGMLDQVRFGVLRTGNVRDSAQMRWAIASADTFARNWIESSFRHLPPAQINRILRAGDVQDIPFEQGKTQFSISDGSNCFALGSMLTSTEQANTAGGRQFVRLLMNLGWQQEQARNFSDRLSDWMDRDSQPQGGIEDGGYLRIGHRTANTNMVSVTELRQIMGMTEDRFRELAPRVCASAPGTGSRININTMTANDAPLLSALLGQDHSALALRLLADRPVAGFSSEEELRAAPALRAADLRETDFASIAFQPHALLLHLHVEWLNKSKYQTRRYITGASSKVQSMQILPRIPMRKEHQT